MSVDNMQIDALLSNDRNDAFKRYANYENVYIPDVNQGQYNGVLNYDSQLQQAFWMDYGSSSVEIPLIIAMPKTFKTRTGAGSGENPYVYGPARYPQTNEIGLAFKNNVANLITGINLKINEVDIVNNSQCNLLNHISTMFDSSNDWSESSGQQYGFFKDTTNNNNSDYNKGLHDRVKFLRPYYVYEGNYVKTIEIMVSIPLKEVTTFFESLSYPLYNCRLRLQLTLSNTQSASSPVGIQNCFMLDHDTVSPSLGGGANSPWANFNWILQNSVPNNPDNGYIIIGKAVKGAQRTGTNFVVPRITYGPETATKLNDALLKGSFVKTNTWIDQKVFYHEKVTIAALGESKDISYNITSGIRKPTRVYCVVYDAVPGTLGRSICSELSPAPCATSTCGLRSMNLEINNTPMFNPMLDADVDFYNLIKKETPSATQDYTTGSLISYNDVVTVNNPGADLKREFGIHKYYCFNLGRLYASGQLTEAPVAIRFVGKLYNNVQANAEVDVFFIVETEAHTEINFANSKLVNLGQAV